MDKEYLIKKWLADELTEVELTAFKELDDYEMHTKILDGAQYFKASDVSDIADVNAVYERMNNWKNNPPSKKKWYTSLVRIAAIFIVALGVSFYFFTNRDTTIETLASQKTTIDLPDASEVIINSKSSIVFNKNTWSDKREVNLEGEAFFKVKKGSSFDVITTAGKVTVLGTQFNVKYRENYFEVKCFEGLVKVKSKECDRNLRAGNTVRIIDGNLTFETINLNLPQWLNNISSFKSVPFYEVIKEFERQYDVTIIMNNIDDKLLFTGGFVHNNLQDGLKSITLPLDLTYTIETTKRIILRNNKK